MENKDHIVKYSHRFLARIIIQAETPLSIGSGEKDIMTDHLVARDVNGLPYIPGTALAGIIRHAIGKEKADLFFGKDGKDGEGSQILFSSAQLIGKDNKAIEGLLLVGHKDEFLEHFDNLPIRQHVRMTDKGTAAAHGKFDGEVVYKGTRFCFEMEMLSEKGNNENLFNECLGKLVSSSFTIGSGTRSGYGECSVQECKKAIFDLTKPGELQKYLDKTSSLNDSFWNNIGDVKNELEPQNQEWTIYQFDLQPDDFFLFGSGFGNDNADMTPVTESVIDWSSGNPEIKENYILIPGSSVKGALSHRVAFYYNKLNDWFVGNENAKIGEDNEAVRALFGFAINSKEIKRGNVIISDIIKYQLGEKNKKVLNHVAIDRFTGGAIDGALFSEEVIYGGDSQQYTLLIKVHNEAFKTEKVKESFEAALDDIKSGMLPLGGGVNRGHGCFRELGK